MLYKLWKDLLDQHQDFTPLLWEYPIKSELSFAVICVVGLYD